jgi:PadR family transcriptional regulator PadR
MGQTNPPFMSGVPEFLCLQVIARGETYGYDIVRRIRLITGEAIVLGEGVVYPVLHSLERAGSLKARRRTVDGRSRVYYRLTARGRKRVEALGDRWQRVRTGLDLALAGGADATLHNQ